MNVHWKVDGGETFGKDPLEIYMKHQVFPNGMIITKHSRAAL